MFSVCVRDMLNHGYFHKRSLYLAGVCKVLKETKKGKEQPLIGDVTVLYFKGDTRKPILEVRPTFSSKVAIRIFPIVSDES